MESTLSRRSFLKWTAVTGATASVAGLTACSSGQSADDPQQQVEEKGQWLTGACMNNCSCGSSKCLVRVYVEDGVPLKIKTDEEERDDIYYPQRRACLRGYGQISNMLSPARIKYPMKRKNWSPEAPNGELRGIDEWERITWDEALDYIAAEMKKTIDTYGSRAILCSSYANLSYTNFDYVDLILNLFGGAVHADMGTVSYGSCFLTETHMCGTMFNAPDFKAMLDCDLHFMMGCNWAVNKGGTHGRRLDYLRESGGKIIIVDPWLSPTAQAIADEWIPIRPGTDTTMMLGIVYHQIVNGLFDQAYLDKYTVGFDADHMPEGAPAEDNFKDYVLGTYDGEPKTPEWAAKICGVPADKIRALAEEIGNTKYVNFFIGQSVSKVPAGEMVMQVFYTMALMHGGIGAPGNYMSWNGMSNGPGGSWIMAGDATNIAANPVNPLTPPGFSYPYYPVPAWAQIEDPNSWEVLEFSECWQSILDGEYGRDTWPGGKKKIDIHMIYVGGYLNALNSNPNVNAGIKAFRKMDFVWGSGPFFDTSRQYCDVVLPVATWWEKANIGYDMGNEQMIWADRIMEPIYESKTEEFIADELSTRLGLDPKSVNTMDENMRRFCTVANAQGANPETGEFGPLFTMTEEDIAFFGVDAQPQEGLTSFAEYKEKGIYKVALHEDDKIQHVVPWSAFYEDPEANPLPTMTGKFEIYCPVLAMQVNSLGFDTIYPIGKWQPSAIQGQGAQTEEFPLLLWTPHTLRRAHTVNDNVASLREAFPQECFMSVVDAEARGIKNGDPVLMTSPYGKVLRPAKVMPGLMPGAVALQDGAWFRIDEETGIDMGGNPNVLQAPRAAGEAIQTWTGTIVQVEKYDGPLELLPDKDCPLVLPVGIEE